MILPLASARGIPKCFIQQYIKYSKFWSISLEYFVERKPLISNTSLVVLQNAVSKSTIIIYVPKLMNKEHRQFLLYILKTEH